MNMVPYWLLQKSDIPEALAHELRVSFVQKHISMLSLLSHLTFRLIGRCKSILSYKTVVVNNRRFNVMQDYHEN